MCVCVYCFLLPSTALLDNFLVHYFFFPSYKAISISQMKEEKPKKLLYVGNLAFTTTVETVRTFFEKCGKVIHCNLECRVL